MIDDSEADAILMRRIVERHHLSIAFKWIDDAESGLKFLLEDGLAGCQLILLDIKMPKMTGLEILRRLRTKGRLSALPPLVIYSSSNLERDRLEAARHPGVSYHTKPDGYHSARSWFSELMLTL